MVAAAHRREGIDEWNAAKFIVRLMEHSVVVAKWNEATKWNWISDCTHNTHPEFDCCHSSGAALDFIENKIYIYSIYRTIELVSHQLVT